jgi:hypothetical protein
MNLTPPRPSLLTARAELEALLAKRGFWLKRVVEDAIRIWRGRAAEVVRRDPFKLMVAGNTWAGFKRCDRLYRDLKLPSARTKRLMFAIWQELREKGGGNTWHPMGVGVEAGLKQRATVPQVDKAIRLGCRSGWLVLREAGNTVWLAVGTEGEAEQRLSERVKELSRWMGRN